METVADGTETFKVETRLTPFVEDFMRRPPTLPFVTNNPSVVTSAENHTPIKTTKETPLVWSLTNRENGSTSSLETESYAFHSMLDLPDADMEPPAHTVTPALCAAISPTDLPGAPIDHIFPIVTKLKAYAWELALNNAGILNEFNDIPVGLREGFFCGLERFSLACTSIPANHYTSQEDEEFIVTKYAEEMALGRLSHGYDPHTLFSLIGHFCTAPLAVIQQDGGKRRIIVNHSYPKK
jgi:hypothetical protein